MKCYKIQLILICIFFGSCLFAQNIKKTEPDDMQVHIHTLEPTEVDSSENFNFAVIAIKGWQKISFSSSFFNCPFYPCCSNYAIHAFSQNGFFKGLLYSTDRISRCHPFANNYYSRTSKGFDNDFRNKAYFKSEHLPCISIPISFAIPGFNKMINGRFFDGLAMLLVTDISAFGAYTSYKNNNYFYVPLTFIFVSFYASDIYFNFLSL